MSFGNLGFGELLMILVIVLVLFGARRVPEIGASIGKGIREFKKNISDVDRQIREPERDARIDRLAGGDREPMAAGRDEESRPEPKRLLS
ncbi:MAG TPA: twin-arginine translocase TatA/TatE family subunit [Gemmatimonadaceae bacterium]|nr:twin-arginine translocase TatA/TatE family subunit [Gemmatimonadaceae bacterium]